MKPILIVGAGPVGLIQAYMLACLDVPVIIIDRHVEHLQAPKSHVVSSRSLEILRQFGLPARTIRKFGTPREEARWVRFVTNLSGDAVGTLPFFRLEPDMLMHTSEILHNIPQPDLEKLIAEQLEQRKNVEIRRGWTWISSTQDEAGVTSVIRSTYKGEEKSIQSSLVIACDGANSKIVQSLDVPSDIEEGADTVMTIHFSADLRPVVKDRVGMLHWIMDPAVRGVIIAYDLGGNLVLLHNFDSEHQSVDSFTPERCRSIIHSALGCDIPFTFLSCLPWRIRRQVAHDYSVGRIVFAGDAAHSFPPTGGFGLNTGIADAHNLSYKLAAVYHGWADLPTVLATYQAERQPVAKRNAWQSVVWGGKIFDLVKAFKTAEPDVGKATAAMHDALADPQQRKLIVETIKDQADQFDSANLDLGYIYEPGYSAEKIIEYIPAYRTGARLVHSWIEVKNPAILPPTLEPVNLDYLRDDVSQEDKEKKQYSILDLIPPGVFVLIHGPDHLQRYVKLSDDLQRQGIPTKRIE